MVSPSAALRRHTHTIFMTLFEVSDWFPIRLAATYHFPAIISMYLNANVMVVSLQLYLSSSIHKVIFPTLHVIDTFSSEWNLTAPFVSTAVRKSTRGNKPATSNKGQEEEDADEEPPASPLRPPSLVNADQVNAKTAPGGPEVQESQQVGAEKEGSQRAEIKGK